MNVGNHLIINDLITAADCGVSEEIFEKNIRGRKVRILATAGIDKFLCLGEENQSFHLDRALAHRIFKGVPPPENEHEPPDEPHQAQE